MGDINNQFGKHLKSLRRRSKETLADVSGAVEVDPSFLGQIEAGKVNPTEDLVMLLIGHFSLREDEAVELWQLAGLDREQPEQSRDVSLPTDKILYTDMVHVSANNYGVVINFMQGLGADGKPSAVSRVGMSREHALSIVDVLTRTLKMTEKNPPRYLGDGK